MADYNEIIKVAVDARKGCVEKYSVAQSQELIRKALIEANNGSTTLNIRDIRDGKCNGLFALVEELLKVTLVDGLQQNDLFKALVDFRNVPLGDKPEFVVEDNHLFVVAEAADGTQGIRRQRLGNSKVATIPTTMKVVRIYEELNRVLAGRVDWNEMVDRVSKSMEQKLLNDIYVLWDGITAADLGGTVYFPTAGNYSEDDLLDIIEHVEAAAGGQAATIIGTKKAIRNIKPSIQSDNYKEEMNYVGYAGKFYGTPVIVVPQRHKIGSTNFIMDDDMVTIIAGDQKPIKVVYEGDPYISMRDPFDNADLTHEFFYGEKYGVGLVVAGDNAGIGRYEFTP